MEGVTFLSVLSAAMFLGSYIAGSIPLLFVMSESRMRVVSIFGAGLLVGTALSVIIPEGVEALYNAQNDMHDKHFHQTLPHANQEQDQVDVHVRSPDMPLDSPESSNGSNGKAKRSADLTGKSPEKATKSSRIRRESHDHVGDEHDHAHSKNGAHHTHGIHKQIGFSLVVGFIFMLLVDQISSSATSRSDRSGRNRMGLSATIGLVVHAAADGIALGSASTINKSDVQLIVFVAIMLHKGPAAFGLVSFLLLEGIDNRNIKKHLLVFSLAAPFAAIVTFIVIQNSGETLASSESNTGVLMLFSAGTFLYVATVHVLPELASQSKASQDYNLVVDVQSPASAGHSHSGGASFTIKELGSIIAGAIVPAILASGHSH